MVNIHKQKYKVNAEDLNIVISVYNFLGYNSNYSIK